MATAGFCPATVPVLACSIPTERIQLLSTSLLYCGSALRERARAYIFQTFSLAFCRLLPVRQSLGNRGGDPPLFQRIAQHRPVDRV